MTDPLRPLWDFDDLDATERRFRALRAEALTQLARVEGLRERYAEGDRLLDEVVEDDARVRIQALDAFERALEVRLRDPENAAAIESAREAVAEAQRALGR